MIGCSITIAAILNSPISTYKQAKHTVNAHSVSLKRRSLLLLPKPQPYNNINISGLLLTSHAPTSNLSSTWHAQLDIQQLFQRRQCLLRGRLFSTQSPNLTSSRTTSKTPSSSWVANTQYFASSHTPVSPVALTSTPTSRLDYSTASKQPPDFSTPLSTAPRPKKKQSSLSFMVPTLL